MTLRLAITLTCLLCTTACGFIPTRRGDLERNRKLWEGSGVDDYRMKVKIEKTGHATPMGTVMIEVRDGQMTSTTKVENEWLGGYVEKCAPYDTIPEIFALIDQAERSGAERLDVSYDATLGYPTNVNMDPKRTTLDDELSWQVLQFEKLN